MLTKSPLFYYNIIRKKYKNSYLAEDDNQIIIGIDCDYIDAYQYSYSSLENYYQQQVSIAPFAGLFGVFAYETIHFFENMNFLLSYLPMQKPIYIIQRLIRYFLPMEMKINTFTS